MPDEFQTIKTEKPFLSSTRNLDSSTNWIVNVSQPTKEFVTTEATIAADFGLNQQHSLKPAMYFESQDSSTEKTGPAVSYDLLQNISSTLAPTAEDAESSTKGPFLMPLTADLIWTFIFGTMIGCAILGNLVVIWIVLGIVT